MKAKKKNAHARASDSSLITSTDKKQPPHLNITSWKENGGSSSFNPNFQFTSAVEVGKNFGRSDHRESVRVFQSKTQEGVGIFSPHHEEFQNGDSCVRRSSLEGNNQPLVAASHRRHKSKGGEEVSLGVDSLDIALANVVHSESMGNGDMVRMEFEGESESPTSN